MIVLTRALARRMLSIHAARLILRGPHSQESVLTLALRPLPDNHARGTYLRRPLWHREKGSRS